MAPVSERHFPVAVGAAGVAGGLLGLLRISQQSLWYDELVSMEIARASWGEMWEKASGSELHSGVYHVTSWFWVRAFGETEAGLRSLSVVFGVATVVMLMVLAKRLFNTRVAMLAAPLFLIHAQTIHFFQEGRTYTLAMFGATAATLALSWALEDRTSTRRWSVYGLAAGLAIYAHLFVGFVVAGHTLALVVRRAWPARQAVLASAATVAVVMSPLLVFTSRGYGNIDWVPATTPGAVHVAVTRVVFGSTGIVWLVPFVALWLWRSWHARDDQRDLFAMTLVTCWLVVPFGLAILVSFWKHVFVSRYFVLCVPASALLTAAAIETVARRSRAIAAVGCGAILLLTGALLADWYRGHPANEDFRGAMTFACSEAEDEGSVLFRPTEAAVASYYATPECGVANSQTRRVVVVRNTSLPLPDTAGWTTIGQRDFTKVSVFTLRPG